MPNILFYPSIEYVEVDFIVPKTYKEKEANKGKRVLRGLLHARQFFPTHIMVVDADGCVTCHIAEFINQNSSSAGWTLNQGYLYQEGKKILHYEKTKFNKWCGTSNILKYDICLLPDSLGKQPDDLISFHSGMNHMNLATYFKDKGLLLEKSPFIGAIYIIGDGKNIYQTGFSTISGRYHEKLFFT